MLRSSFPSASHGLVYINTPSRTYLHELCIEYEQVTTWEARFSSNKLEANYHMLSAAVCTWTAQWTCAQVAITTVWLSFKQPVGRNHWPSCDTAHTGSFITRRSHLNLLWIHIVLSKPMIYKLCWFTSRSNMENLKPTP